MIGIQNGKDRNLEKPFPGCLGRMVNLFDLSTGMPGNKLLTEKPHRDGSPLSRSRSDVTRMLSPIGDQIEDKLVVSELRRTSSNKKSNGTPMKMLIAQEMSKEVESKHNPPSVVAKLMGLDALPKRQSDLAAQGIHSKSYSRNNVMQSGMPLEPWEQENGFLDKQMQREVHQCQEQTEYKDVYEIWQQSQRTSYTRDKSPQKGRYGKEMDEKKMALVRQKFVEAKRLATDEKLRQSKEFKDALEVLSSNKDMFLKFLQEPNSLFSQHLYEYQSIPPSPETKRITVLKPSKTVEGHKYAGSVTKSEKQIKKPVLVMQANGRHQDNHDFSPTFSDWRACDNPTQPTRIVVLKPSPGMSHEIKAVVSPPSSSPRIFSGEEFYEETEDDEARESREVAKEITRHMRENLSGHRRDETLLSSVFSNGYIGDESSFNKSETEYAGGNVCDSEIISPTSRQSWDYINRFGSPYASSSFSRASFSPESSVCREAKKRLSERWAMMALNGNSHEQRHVRRSSSTLGEMLALSEITKSINPEGEDENKEQESRGSTSCLAVNLNKDAGMDDSPKNLLRSKSVPVSSTVYGARLNVELSGPEVGKTPEPKELTKAKSMKTSLKGKVSSFFFSRNKKSREKSSASASKDESHASTSETPVTPVHTHGEVGDRVSDCVDGSSLVECLSPGLHASSRDSVGIASCEAGLSVAKHPVPANPCENQDQPSPVSVLEPPFEEDDATSSLSSGSVKPDHLGTKFADHHMKYNLLDKSPPIESIARTLSWDDSSRETATPYSLKPSLVSSGLEEEQDWLLLVRTLLSAAGLDGEMQTDTFFGRWHSPESPLDPTLRDGYVNLNNKEFIHEDKRRQPRSSRYLVFDCVNAALVDIAGYYGSEWSHKAKPVNAAHICLLECSGAASPILVDQVWSRMKEWFSGEMRCVPSGDGGDEDSLVVERVVRWEVVGKGWIEGMGLETDNVEKEIEKKLLEELVEEAVVELTGRV